MFKRGIFSKKQYFEAKITIQVTLFTDSFKRRLYFLAKISHLSKKIWTGY